MSCAPVCEELTYGFLLSIEIDGKGTVMTCNKVDDMFSWQGQASFGGYIGDDFGSFFSSVVSGAAGTCMGTLTEDAGVSTDLTIQPGQAVLVTGDRSLARRRRSGADAGSVQAGGSLSLAYVGLGSVWAFGTYSAGTSITLSSGGSLSLASVTVPEALLGAVIRALDGAGSALRLSDVIVLEYRSDDTCLNTYGGAPYL